MNLSPIKAGSLGQLRDLQRMMAAAVMRPLTSCERMKPRWKDGRSMKQVAACFIKPNDRLTSFERLEIYNRQYWFRILSSFYDDYPGLRTVLGDSKFEVLAREYLTRHPSRSFTLRNLGRGLEQFIIKEPRWTRPLQALALDMARVEWAKVVAFDGEAREQVRPDDLAGLDPSKIRLRLQPYITILKLNYPVDDFLLEIKKRNELRNGTSNAVKSRDPAGKQVQAESKSHLLPKPSPIHVAIHRINHSIYYKRLEPEACRILMNLSKGIHLKQACLQAFDHTEASNGNWSEKVKGWFQNWAALGWFCHYSSRFS